MRAGALQPRDQPKGRHGAPVTGPLCRRAGVSREVSDESAENVGSVPVPRPRWGGTQGSPAPSPASVYAWRLIRSNPRNPSGCWRLDPRPDRYEGRHSPCAEEDQGGHHSGRNLQRTATSKLGSSSNRSRTTTDSRADPISRQLAFSNGLQSALLIRLASGSGQRFQRSSLVTLSPRPWIDARRPSSTRAPSSSNAVWASPTAT